MDVRRLKEGAVLRLKSGFLGKKWKECYAVLYSDSTFCWYDRKSDSRPAGSVFLKDVVPYVCIGLVCDRMPVQRPKLPQGFSIHHLVGIGLDPRASKVHWFLFSSDSHLESWFLEIAKTLPKPEPVPSSAPQQDLYKDKNAVPVYNPPSVYPPGPPPVTTNYQPTSSYQNPYPNGQPPPAYSAGPGVMPTSAAGTTVIVQDRGCGYNENSSYRGNSGSGFGGMGTGLLLGGLMGYGLGSCWGGGFHHYGGFGGYPVGYGGFGGGYVQDNDTYITNNYYGGDTTNTTIDQQDSTAVTNVTDANNAQDSLADNQVDSYGGGYDFGDAGISGGNDFGGGDFGGTDFGGADLGEGFGGTDFGGGDFSFGGDF